MSCDKDDFFERNARVCENEVVAIGNLEYCEWSVAFVVVDETGLVLLY